MGRNRHGPRSTWARINMGRSRWAEIDVGRDRPNSSTSSIMKCCDGKYIDTGWVRACVCDVFAIYDNNISPSLLMIIIKIIILYFIQFQIRHTDNFPPTGTPASRDKHSSMREFTPMQLLRVKNCYDNGVIKFVLGSIVKWLGPLCYLIPVSHIMRYCTAMPTICNPRARRRQRHSMNSRPPMCCQGITKTR